MSSLDLKGFSLIFETFFFLLCREKTFYIRYTKIAIILIFFFKSSISIYPLIHIWIIDFIFHNLGHSLIHLYII